MGHLAMLLVSAVCSFTTIVAKLEDPGGAHKLQYDKADSFKVFENFPFSVAVGDSDNDGILECIAANRTEIDPEAQTATFVWLFQATDTSPESLEIRDLSVVAREHWASMAEITPNANIFLLRDKPEQLDWRAVPFYAKVGDEPGTLTFTVENDPTPREGIYYYADYDACVVLDLEYRGHQCILWTKRSLKDNVPQDCIDQFVDTCGVEVPPHSRDLCNDGEGDY